MATSLDVCGLCLNEPVFGFCENCSIRLGKKCFSVHKKVSLFTGHITFPLNESNQIANIPVQRENDIHEQTCSVHKTDTKSLYCMKHDATICGRCMRSDHRSCLDDIIDLHEVRFDEHRSDELMTTLKQLEEEVSTIETRIADNFKSNDECKATCIKAIRNYSERFLSILDQLREIAIMSTEVKHKANTFNLSQVYNKCKETKHRIQKECDLIRELSQKNHERHLFVVSKRLGKDIDEIKTVIRQSNMENSISKFSFQENKTIERTLQNDFSDIGRLQEACDGSEEIVEDTHNAEATQADTDSQALQPTKINRDTASSEELPKTCVICMDDIDQPKKLECGHIFCTLCIDLSLTFKQACPTCGEVCGIMIGYQPPGMMKIHRYGRRSCAGYESVGRIEISYHFKSGTQTSDQPTPGKSYNGISRCCLFPDNTEGTNVCRMLKVAFERKLVFTIGRSRLTGEEGVITWSIHHKTDYRPNTQFGYPDPTYLERVTDELKAKGVTHADIDPNDILESIVYSH